MKRKLSLFLIAFGAFIVIYPVIFTGTKKGVLSFKVRMIVEVHPVPPLYSLDI